MQKKNNRRSFLKKAAIGGLGVTAAPGLLLTPGAGRPAPPLAGTDQRPEKRTAGAHAWNGAYSGDHLSRVAFPVGAMGAGMFCVEGTGAISHMSVGHRPELFHEPAMFAAIAIK